MIYATKDGKVYRFTPDRFSRFLYNYSMRGEMPDLEKSGKVVGEGVVSLDGWNVESARDALVGLMGRGSVRPPNSGTSFKLDLTSADFHDDPYAEGDAT